MRFGRHTQNNFALAWPCLGSTAFCVHPSHQQVKYPNVLVGFFFFMHICFFILAAIMLQIMKLKSKQKRGQKANKMIQEG